jgi:hypothetical protein
MARTRRVQQLEAVVLLVLGLGLVWRGLSDLRASIDHRSASSLVFDRR